MNGYSKGREGGEEKGEGGSDRKRMEGSRGVERGRGLEKETEEDERAEEREKR